MQKRFEKIVNNRYNGELEKAISAFLNIPGNTDF